MAETKISNTDTYQGVYPTVFKKINSSDVSLTPFQSYKQWEIGSGSATSSCLPLQGVYSDVLPALDTELTYNDAKNIDGSLQTVTYYSVNQLFYKYKDQPYNTLGPTDLNRTHKYLYQTASIFSIPQLKYGESVKPGSVEIKHNDAILKSDRYGNLYNNTIDTASFATGVMWYEGFNEYFDTNRVPYASSGVTYVPGVPDADASSLPVGLAAKFDGAGYIESDLNGFYDRDHDYAIAFWFSGSSNATQLIATKASSSLTPQYPFRIELSGSNQIVFSVAGSTTFKTQITSSVFNTTNWNHFICQKSGSSVELYVNGALESSATSPLLINTQSPLSASARIDNTDKLYIGGYTTGSNLTGVIDEVRIFNKSLSATEIGSLATPDLTTGTLLQTNHVGNIFAKQGIAVVSTPDYRFHNIVNDFIFFAYKSTVTIYELGVVVKLDAGDFNMSLNPTLTVDNDITYRSFVTSSTFTPYITTIGLYDDAGQLLAIGKLAQPIKKPANVDLNFLVRMDLNNNVIPR